MTTDLEVKYSDLLGIEFYSWEGDSMDRFTLLKQYGQQNDGILTYPIYLSEPINDQLQSITDDQEAVFTNLQQVGRGDSALLIETDVDDELYEDELVALDSIPEQFIQLIQENPVQVIYPCANGVPGFYLFGEILGRQALMKKYWDPPELRSVLLTDTNLKGCYEEGQSDHGTRYIFEKFGIDVCYPDSDIKTGDFSLQKLSSISTEIEKDEIVGKEIDVEKEQGFPGKDASGEERVLNWYHKNNLESGPLFREFRVTNCIANSARQRALDGLLICNGEENQVYKPTLQNGGYEYAKHLIDQNYPLIAIEVHKWGWEGFGQVVGKATLLEDFWDAPIVRKVLVVKNNQGRSFERLDRENPQVDLESIMADYGVEIVIAPEDI